MEKQREKAAQRLQRKQLRQPLPSEDAMEYYDTDGLDGADGADDTTTPAGETTPVAD